MDESAWRTATHPYQPIDLLGWVAPQLTQQQRLRIAVAWMRRIWDLLADPRFRQMVDVADGLADGTRTEADFNEARAQLPGISNWTPSEPPLIDEPRGWRPITFTRTVLTGRPSPPTPGVVNFSQLPWWVRQTHIATARFVAMNLRDVSYYTANARAGHSAEHAPEIKAIDDINEKITELQRKYDDAVWRGLSGAAQMAAELLQQREQAEERIRALRDEQSEIALRTEWAAQTDLLRCVAGNPFRPPTIPPSWRSETVLALARGIDRDQAHDRLPILADALQEAGCDDDTLLAHCRCPHHTRYCHALTAVLDH